MQTQMSEVPGVHTIFPVPFAFKLEARAVSFEPEGISCLLLCWAQRLQPKSQSCTHSTCSSGCRRVKLEPVNVEAIICTNHNQYQELATGFI